MDRRDVVFARPFEGIGIGLVADHDSDLRSELTVFDIVDDRLEVRAAAGDEDADADFFHRNSNYAKVSRIQSG